jgi:hypothetical protein
VDGTNGNVGNAGTFSKPWKTIAPANNWIAIGKVDYAVQISSIS